MDDGERGLTPRALLVAVGGGALLVALLLALSVVTGGDDADPVAAATSPAPGARPAGTTPPVAAAARATTPSATTPSASSPSATTPGTTPTTPVGRSASSPVSAPSPEQARDLVRVVLSRVERCQARMGTYLRCTTAGELGELAVALAPDPPRPGEAAVTATVASYYVRVASADGRLWGVHRRAGSLQLRRTCHEADGTTPCATAPW